MIQSFSTDHLKGKNILITGGTGSFGKKFLKTVLERTEINKAIIFSRDEFKQYSMKNELKDFPYKEKVRFFLGDVRDPERLEMALKGVDIVVHAAALKHVPFLEYNPFEAIKTNILGTKNVIEAAIKNNVEKVIFISTDKAANPANLYGATKLCAERLIISGNAYGAGITRLSAVRYGNVFGSRGSFIELLEKQKEKGVITITHEKMTRYWITIDQGVAFVMNCLKLMNGGEIFVPKIPSMEVKDLALALAPECQVEIIGIRPGEKLHEKLITEEESRRTIELEDYFVIMPEFEWWEINSSYKDGKKLPEGFCYSSDKNEKKLTLEDLRKFMEGYLH